MKQPYQGFSSSLQRHRRYYAAVVKILLLITSTLNWTELHAENLWSAYWKLQLHQGYSDKLQAALSEVSYMKKVEAEEWQLLEKIKDIAGEAWAPACIHSNLHTCKDQQQKLQQNWCLKHFLCCRIRTTVRSGWRFSLDFWSCSSYQANLWWFSVWNFFFFFWILVCCREQAGLSGLLGIFKHLLYL